MMIDNLTSHNFNLDKLETFDSSIETYKPSNKKFDLVFIDGEHTDIACFRDFVYAFQLLKKDSICMFHDSSIVYKGIQSALIYLDVHQINYKFIKILDSEMSMIFLGNTTTIDFNNIFSVEDLNIFYKKSEEFRITSIIENKVNHKLEVVKIIA
jgi:hypothetical protein